MASRRFEYRFKIDAFTPDTIPMSRLAEYVADLARMLGNNSSVHLRRIEGGSTVPVVLVDREAIPKIRARIDEVKRREAPAEAQKAHNDIDRRLIDDNGSGVLLDPTGAKVIRFAGRENATRLKFGPIEQAGVFQGIPIRVGGESDPVPVHLEDGKDKHIVLARRSLAKEIAQHLFSSVIRVEGTGRWVRHADGEWEMLSFRAGSMKPIEDADIRRNIQGLQEIAAEWKKLEDPLDVLQEIRSGKKLQ